MSNYTTNTEFIVHELHTLVSEPALYDWEAIWGYLRDYDAILYVWESGSFHWDEASDYMQTPDVLYDLIDSYALDTHVIEQRYVAGELWTRRLRYNAATGGSRGIAYTTGNLVVSAVYDADGTRYAAAGNTFDGKQLSDSDADATWVKADQAWERS